MTPPEVHQFVARCKDCRRRLGDVQLPRDHQFCGVVFQTVCRTATCRGRKIEVRFDHTITARACELGF